jgi:hypothetical protein
MRTNEQLRVALRDLAHRGYLTLGDKSMLDEVGLRLAELEDLTRREHTAAIDNLDKRLQCVDPFA